MSIVLSVETQSCRLDGEIVFQVALKNTTNSVVEVPWEPDWRKIESGFDKPPPGYLAGRLYLTATSDLFQKKELADISLSGSDLVSGSIRNLAPGETVYIRAAGKWTFGEADQRALERHLPAPVQLTVQFNFLYGLKNPGHAPRVTSDSVTVQLSP